MIMLLTDTSSNSVYFSTLIKDFTCYHSIVKKLNKYQIKHGLLSHTKDYWVRDFMPIQISENKFIHYIYNPDYLANEPNYITNPNECFKSLNIDIKSLNVILDGGNVIKCSDSIIMTDKVFVENKNLTKIRLINTLENTLGCEVIFIPWDKNEIYGHADGMVRYIEDRKVLLNNYCNSNKLLRSKIVKVLQDHFDIVELSYNIPKPSANNWAYINYLQVQNLILLPTLGIAEDEQAYQQFGEIFPNHQIEQVDMSEIVKFGGTLNCISWNIKH